MKSELVLGVLLVCCVSAVRAHEELSTSNAPPAAVAAPAASALVSSPIAASTTTSTQPTAQPGSDSPINLRPYLGTENVANHSGAFTYSVPLEVPPDPFGLLPELALGYESQVGNGPVGLGWGIKGLSVIANCPRTPADVEFGPLAYDGTDPLCLDGSRLVLVSGHQGADGSMYRTASETWLRAQAMGSAGGAPAHFVVNTRQRLRLTYGGSNDSRVEVPGLATAYLWALSRIEDASGNFATISYEELTGIHRVARIDYTGHLGTGVAPRHSIRFVYEARTDRLTSFVAGHHVVDDQRLASIQTWIDDQQILEYRLEYEMSEATSRSRLTRITKCAGSACLPPTRIQWADDGTQAWETNRTKSSAHGSAEFVALADVNGDGLPDFVARNNDPKIHWHLNFGSDWSSPLSQQGDLAPLGLQNWMEDINRDGRADFIAYDAHGALQWNIATGDGTTPSNWGSTQSASAPLAGDQRWLADINGDGLTDFVVKHQNTIHWSLNTGSSFASSRSQVTQSPMGDPAIVNGRSQRPAKSWLADINGDGKADYVSFRSNAGPNGKLYWNLSVGDGTTSSHWGPTHEKSDVPGRVGALATLADINGDGLPDYVTTDGATLHWNLNTGIGWRGNLRQDGLHGYGDDMFGPQLVDINGDGKADYVVKHDDKISWNLAVGDGTTPEHWSSRDYQQDGLHPFGAEIFSGSWHGFASWFRDLNGDGKADYLAKPMVGSILWNLASTRPTDRVVAVQSPLGAEIRVEYHSLAGPGLHQRDFDAVFPLVDVQPATLGVRSLTKSDGIGGWDSTTIRWIGGKADLLRRRWAGFRALSLEHSASGHRTDSTFLQSFPLDGRLQAREERLRDGTVFERITNRWRIEPRADGRTVEPLLAATQQETFEIDGSPVTWRRTSFTYDDYGNTTEEDAADSDGLRRHVLSQFHNDPDAWFLGLPTRDETRRSSQTAAERRHVTTRRFDNAGLLLEEALEAETTGVRVSTFERDARGLPTKVVVTAGDESRSTRMTYDFLGFLSETKNPAGHHEMFVTDPTWGLQSKHTAPDGVVTQITYDSFGRTVERATGGRGRSEFSYVFEPPPGGMRITTSESNGAVHSTLFDVLGRPRLTDSLGFAGRHILTDKLYDARGRLEQQSRPYFQGTAALWERYLYDDLDRRVATVLPGGQVLRTEFAGLETRSIDALGRPTVRRRSAAGWLLEEIDAVGAATRYGYDADGNILTIIDVKGTLTAFEYDRYGNLTGLSDPGKGAWRFSYNGFAELTERTDAEGRTTRQERDEIGRVTREVQGDFIEEFQFDAGAHAVGKLVTASSSNGYRESHTFDQYGRPEKTSLRIGSRTYETAWVYDDHGRVLSIAYPGGLVIEHTYDPHGPLSRIDETGHGTAPADRQLVWQAVDYDAQGRVVVSHLGNGITATREFEPTLAKLTSAKLVTADRQTVHDFAFAYDFNGNLIERRDNLAGSGEAFAYDRLDRLVSWTTPSVDQGGNVQALGTASYDVDGNILSKEGVGNYFYRQTASGPHAVSYLARPGAQLRLDYDRNGNMTSGLGRRFHYGTSSLPDRIDMGRTGLSSTKGERVRVRLLYDNEDGRIQKVSRFPTVFRPRGRRVTTDYVNGLFERTDWHCGELERSFIRAGDELVAVAVELDSRCRCDSVLGPDVAHLLSQRDRHGRARDTLFVAPDQISSIVAVSNAAGRIVA
ncbi:MAG: FG-GAP-like repeat-containing protein, partial [Thermoanaerobaculia bacterium]|nr:FG-GAP-like repeat-containing protein [Thermoanaerobaculia bacterium]